MIQYSSAETQKMGENVRRQFLADQVELAASPVTDGPKTDGEIETEDEAARTLAERQEKEERDRKEQAAEKLVKQIKPFLGIAFLDPKIKEWSRRDPDFARLRGRESFRVLGRTPIRTDAWSLAQFGAMKAKATEIGYETPAELALLGSSKSNAKYFGIEKVVLSQKIRVARFLRTATSAAEPDAAIKSVLLELFSGLLDAGVTRTADLTSEWLADGTMAKTPKHPLIPIVRKVNSDFGKSIDLPDVIDWVNRMVDPAYKRPGPAKPATSTAKANTSTKR